jgi:hypothetical protein
MIGTILSDRGDFSEVPVAEVNRPEEINEHND